MKLYLSSRGLGNCPQHFRNLMGSNKRVAVIINAQDLLAPEQRLEKLYKEISDLTALGLQPEELDLRDYFDKPNNLPKFLERYGAVWVRGGNVFVLRRAMKQSRFDETIVRLVKGKQLVYGGFSAGSCVTSPTLRGIELVDDASVVPQGYVCEAIWGGLGLVPYVIVPHYKSDHSESPAIEKLVAYLGCNHIPYRALHDGEAIVIAGKTELLLT